MYTITYIYFNHGDNYEHRSIQCPAHQLQAKLIRLSKDHKVRDIFWEERA